MIKAFLFDLGNVLVEFSHDRMVSSMADVMAVTPDVVLQVLEQDRLQWRYESGLVSEDELFAKLQDVADRPMIREDLFQAACDAFGPMEPMWRLLERLKQNEFRLVMVSNTNAVHIRHLRDHYPCFDHFDELVFSYRIQAMKPEVTFYEHALQAAKCERHECLFIDDRPENVEGARRFGFQAHWFVGYESLLSELEVLGLN